MNCPICGKEKRAKTLRHLPPAAGVLCFQCQKNAKQSARSTSKLASDKKLMKKIDKKITFMLNSCVEIFYVDDYTLSKDEFRFIETMFLDNFSGYMKQRWPALKLERVNRSDTAPQKEITETQFNDYLIKKLNSVAKNMRASR